MSHYNVEFNGQCYVVTKDGAELVAFIDCVSAYDAKRDFESKRFPQDWQKVPPAMRMAKSMFYGK